MSDEAWQLRTSFGRPDSGGWNMEVNLERARRYRSIDTLAEFQAIGYPGATTPLPPTPDAVELSDQGAREPGQPGAFISYSHQDDEFVLALVEKLKDERAFAAGAFDLYDSSGRFMVYPHLACGPPAVG